MCSMHFATGGATDHVFALCKLLGFRFAPRLRDIADRKLGSIAVPSTYKRIESPMGCTIETAASWPPTSGKTGWILPLAELGRIERMLFTLDWLEQPDLRRAYQAGLNKGEARHTLAAAIYTSRQGRFTDRLIENQEYRVSSLNLVIAAIVCWTTIYMNAGLHHLRSSKSSSTTYWPHTPRERTTMLASSATSHAIWLGNRPAVRCSTSRKVAVQQKRSQITCL